MVCWIVGADRFWLVCDAHTLLPVVFGLLYVNGPLAGSESGSKQTALLDGRACDYDPRAEKSWADVDRDVEQRSRNDARYHQRRAARQILTPLPHRFHCLSSSGKCLLGVLQSDAPLPADWTIGFYPHHEVIKPWQQTISLNRGRIGLSSWRLKFLLKSPHVTARHVLVAMKSISGDCGLKSITDEGRAFTRNRTCAQTARRTNQQIGVQP